MNKEETIVTTQKTGKGRIADTSILAETQLTTECLRQTNPFCDTLEAKWNYFVQP